MAARGSGRRRARAAPNPDRARAAEGLARKRRRTTARPWSAPPAPWLPLPCSPSTLGSGGDGNDAVDTTSEGPAFVVECPPITVGKGGIAEGVDEPDPDAPDAVPEGATSARLCQGVGTELEVPEEALVSGVDDLVAAVNAQDVTGEPEMCTMDLGPGYRIAFGYDDGSSFVVSGQLYGCHTLVVGSGYRANPEAAQAAFLGLLAEQQRDADGETSADAARRTWPAPTTSRCSHRQPRGPHCRDPLHRRRQRHPGVGRDR